MSKKRSFSVTFSHGKAVIAFDVGRKYIGVASTDSSGSIAFPRDTLVWDGTDQHLTSLLGPLFQEHQFAKCLVGVNASDKRLTQSGGMSVDASRVTHVLEQIQKAPVILVDEHVNTIEAENRMAETVSSGLELKKMRKDALAAQIILERYLASENS